jgi:putative Ca2+/H+ antiporter (TMEM165/GDT1 family)
VNLLLIPLSFAVILVAELPDKSMLAAVVLSTRFPARWVFLGAAAAFAIHTVIAVSAGSVLGLLPRSVLDVVVGVLFALASVVLLRASLAQRRRAVGGHAPAVAVTNRPWAAVGASFGVVFLSEWGDITQLSLANMVAAYGSPVAIGVGGLAGLLTATLLGVTVGRALLRRMSATLLHRIGAAVFAVLAVLSFVEAIR